MSYKKKKQKKNIVNQLKRKLGLIKIVLLKKYSKLKPKKEVAMLLPQTIKIMTWLRKRSKIIRPNNQKINEWVESYINTCILNGKPVEILTQLCISKMLELRYKTQGSQLVPTKAERATFLEEIPEIIECFNSNGAQVNWCITMNRSFLDSGRIDDEKIENEYVTMIQSLISESGVGDILLYDWEDELLQKRSEPNVVVLSDVSRYVSDDVLKLQIIRHSSWVRDSAKLNQTDTAIENDVRFEIACEAEEGRFLLSQESPWPNGQFILMPFENAERYIFFRILEPKFTERIVSVLRANPWRLKSD